MDPEDVDGFNALIGFMVQRGHVLAALLARTIVDIERGDQPSADDIHEAQHGIAEWRDLEAMLNVHEA